MLPVVLIALTLTAAQAFVCPPDFCSRVRCAAVTAESCVGGSIVRNGGTCGCCDTCVQQLGEGESCVSSVLLGVAPSATCATGLTCDPTTLTCQRPKDFVVSRRQTQTCAELLAQSNSQHLLGRFTPRCEADGSYSAVQCHGSVCYCADQTTGDKILDYQASIGQSSTMDCRCARDQAAYMKTGLIGKLFYCTDNGSYRKYRCSGSVCFCSDELGNMKTGSQTVNIGHLQDLHC